MSELSSTCYRRCRLQLEQRLLREQQPAGDAGVAVKVLDAKKRKGTKRWASRHQGSEHQVLHCLISFACEDVQCAANCFLSKQRAVILFPVK